ncbi:MAG TPA: 30S ribosomal protein S27ae [Nitrososphaera sp.]|nr:30S ribosomal protein S27ae [uncultured Nitrososphaera sp.]HEU4985173.1 30S ribosomal protein S27ae [Nitrososphaera sp.]HZT34688.1 30S ribosomal protein S27ae [Nitrososphaera sp.]
MADKKAPAKGEVAVYKFYKVEGNKVTRNKRECLKCGKGVFMAEHKDRFTCGKCGYTEFARKEAPKNKAKK